MHILGIILAVLGGAAVWYWRLKILRDAGNDVADMVGRARGAYRMRRFKAKSDSSALASVDDPALAAAILLYTIANEDPQSRFRSDAEIRAQLADIVAPAKLGETLAYADWAAKSVVDPKDCIRRFRALWLDKLTRDERADLVRMADAVARSGAGTVQGTQAVSLEALRTALIYQEKR